MGDERAMSSRDGLVRAIEDNLFALFGLFRRWPEATVRDGPDLLSCVSDIPFPLFNSVLHARLTPETADRAIQAVVGRYRDRGVPALWWTGPQTTPADLGDRLRAHGFVHAGDMPGMACRLSDPPASPDLPAGLAIECVEDGEGLRLWCAAVCRGFGMPDFVGEALGGLCRSLGMDADGGLRNYLGRREGAPVTAASLFLGAGVGGIYNVATVPEARGQGLGTAITRAALRDARQAGCRAAILHTTSMGERVYRRLGFEPYCSIGQYVWTPASAAGEPAQTV